MDIELFGLEIIEVSYLISNHESNGLTSAISSHTRSNSTMFKNCLATAGECEIHIFVAASTALGVQL